MVREVIGIVDEAGGIAAARQRGEQFAEEAEQALRPTCPRVLFGRRWLATITYVMERRS